jgi:hypothetical protein
MFTKQQKEHICQEVYDWTTSSYLTATWKALDTATKQRILAKVDIYLNEPWREEVLERILEKFDPEAIATEITGIRKKAHHWHIHKW